MRFLLPAIMWGLVLCATGAARAESKPKDPTGYTQAVTLGLQEFEDKNFAEARAHFLRAHAISPNARTLRALGMVEFELKRYAESARLLSEALASKEKPLDAEKRAHAQALLERANGYIGKITLAIGPDTTVIVDGITTGLATGNELVLEVGDHTLEFQASAHIAQKRNVTIRGGEQSTLRVQLAPLKSPVEASRAEAPSALQPAAPPGPQKERRALKSPWLWTAIGLVVAGAAAGAAIAITRDDPSPQMAEPYPGTGGAPVLSTPP